MLPLTGKWYPRLKPNETSRYSLFNYIHRQQASHYFLVYSMDDGYKDKVRNYAAFRSSTEFYHYYITVEDPEIHEIILGEMTQKCRFDIDLTPDKAPEGISLIDFGDQIRELILDSMAEVLKTYNVELDIAKNIVYCTSHSKTKYSAHLILADYYHNNYQEALTFFDQIINSNEILQHAVKDGIIDRSIFSTNHSMRLLGSYKDGVRQKKLVDDIIHHSEIIEFIHPTGPYSELMKFRRSCITDTIGCKYLNVIVPIKPKANISNVMLPAGYEDKLIELLVKYEGAENYDIVGITDGGLVDLRRKHSSYCKICRRIHENIDPFLRVSPGGLVSYYCRQSSVVGDPNRKHQSKPIGILKIDTGKKVVKANIKTDGEEESEEDVEIKVKPEIITKTKVRMEEEDVEVVDDVDDMEEDKGGIVYEGCNFDLLRSMSRQSYKV